MRAGMPLTPQQIRNIVAARFGGAKAEAKLRKLIPTILASNWVSYIASNTEQHLDLTHCPFVGALAIT
jgi:hypothetical protein